MKSDTVKAWAMLAALAGVGYIVWRGSQAAGKVGDTLAGAGAAVGSALSSAGAAVGQVVTRDINPASPDNVVNRAVSAVGSAATGQSNWSLGSAIYDWLHPNQLDLTAPSGGRPVMPDQTAAETARLKRLEDAARQRERDAAPIYDAPQYVDPLGNIAG